MVGRRDGTCGQEKTGFMTVKTNGVVPLSHGESEDTLGKVKLQPTCFMLVLHGT